MPYELALAKVLQRAIFSTLKSIPRARNTSAPRTVISLRVNHSVLEVIASIPIHRTVGDELTF